LPFVEKVIEVFTHPKILELITSDKCTLIKAKIPLKGSSQFIEFDCGMFFNLKVVDSSNKSTHTPDGGGLSVA
jgi:pterin-4a-carbinolamine dehydratase